MESVAAVVVTFNRLEKLKKVIASLEGQSLPLERVIIVDNASTDGTPEYLNTLQSSLRVDVLRLGTNTGGAGGFARGMDEGYASGCDYVWVMDDDCYPQSDALAKLVSGFHGAVAELGGDVPFACSLVKYIDGSICEMNNPEPTWDWGRLIAKGHSSVMVKSCSFVSVLIPRWVLESHGLPYPEYFIWFDDHEYTLRLTGICPGVQVTDSIVVHDMGDNKGVNFSLIDDKNAWKFAYGIRNEASFRLHHQSALAFLMFTGRVLLGMRRGRVKAGLQWKMLRRLWDGVRFNPEVKFPSTAD